MNNCIVLSNDNVNPKKVSKVTRPSQCAIVLETANWIFTYKYNYHPTQGRFDHTNGANVLYVDGHANWMKRESIPNPNLNPSSKEVSIFWHGY